MTANKPFNFVLAVWVLFVMGAYLLQFHHIFIAMLQRWGLM